MLLVRDDVNLFPIATIREKIFLALTLAMIIVNFVGWTFYYTGHQYGCDCNGRENMYYISRFLYYVSGHLSAAGKRHMVSADRYERI